MEGTLHLRFLVAHGEEPDKIFSSLNEIMKTKYADFTIVRSPIQDENSIPAGWLKGSITELIHLEFLQREIQQRLPSDSTLEWKLENREVLHELPKPSLMGGFKKKTDLACTATYVITKEEHLRELTELMCSVVYPRGMTTTDAPGHMALQFVPDVTLPMNSASKTMKAVHFKWLLNTYLSLDQTNTEQKQQT